MPVLDADECRDDDDDGDDHGYGDGSSGRRGSSGGGDGSAVCFVHRKIAAAITCPIGWHVSPRYSQKGQHS